MFEMSRCRFGLIESWPVQDLDHIAAQPVADSLPRASGLGRELRTSARKAQHGVAGTVDLA